MAKEREIITYNERVISDPKVLAGKPIVKGTRISVDVVLGRLAANPDLTDLLAGYPRLTADDVKACLDFASSVIEEQQGRTRKQPAPSTPGERLHPGV